jgi:nucleoside-diphosphate-sugar epimerase
MPQTLIIGGSYFIGRALVTGLLEAGHVVTVLNRGTRVVPGVAQLVADRDDAPSLNSALAGRSFDYVIDVSCYTPEQAEGAYLALGGRFRRWVLISSAAVYEDTDRYPIHEGQPLGYSAQWEDYGLQKLAAERKLESVSTGDSGEIVVLRPPYIFGPGNNLAREQWLWSRMLRGETILVPGNGLTDVQFLHTSDLVAAVSLALGADGLRHFTVLNVGNPAFCSFSSYLETLSNVAGVGLKLTSVPYENLGLRPRQFFPFRDYPCVLATDAIQTQLGWAPERTLRDGLEKTFESYDREVLARSHPATEAEQKIRLQIGC